MILMQIKLFYASCFRLNFLMINDHRLAQMPSNLKVPSSNPVREVFSLIEKTNFCNESGAGFEQPW